MNEVVNKVKITINKKMLRIICIVLVFLTFTSGVLIYVFSISNEELISKGKIELTTYFPTFEQDYGKNKQEWIVNYSNAAKPVVSIVFFSKYGASTNKPYHSARQFFFKRTGINSFEKEKKSIEVNADFEYDFNKLKNIILTHGDICEKKIHKGKIDCFDNEPTLEELEKRRKQDQAQISSDKYRDEMARRPKEEKIRLLQADIDYFGKFNTACKLNNDTLPQPLKDEINKYVRPEVEGCERVYNLYSSIERDLEAVKNSE